MVLSGIHAIMSNVYDFFQLQIVIDQYSFTLWNVLLFSMVCVIVARFIGGIVR